MKQVSTFIVCILTLLILSGPLSADVVTPYIKGTSTAEFLLEGPYEGWWRYDINIEWAHNWGLSHLDLILKPGCALEDHLIVFDVPAGFSTSEAEPNNPQAMGWSGYFNRKGDPSLDIEKPVLKFNSPFFPPDAEPGKTGHGVFTFYSNIIPEKGTFANALVFKADSKPAEYGELEGDYPSCTIVPEPATLCLLGLGSLSIFIRKK